MAHAKTAPQLVSAQVTPKKAPQSKTPAPSLSEGSARKAIASKARKPPKDDAELKRNAIKGNPPGVRIYNPNLENAKAVMAGYLSLADTNELAQLLAREDNAKLLTEFLEARKSGFGILDRNEGSTWSSKGIFECIESSGPVEQALFDVDTIPIKHHQVPGTTLKSTSPGYLTWLNVMHRLILQNKDCFKDDSTLSPQKGLHTAEDWFRAYCIIRLHYRNATLAAKQTKGNARGPMNLAAEQPKFLVDSDFRASAIAGKDDEPAEDPTEDSEDDEDDDDSVVDTAGAELQDKIEKAYEDGALTMSSGGDLNAVTKGTGRPALTRAQVGRFLQSEGKKARVLHDVAKKPNHATESVIQAADAAASISAIEQDDIRNDAYTRERQDFWKLMGEVSTVSVPTVPYLECCKELGIDPETRSFGDEGKAFQPWQVIGIHKMLSMEDGVLGGGINACDCGTGKTVTCLGLIEQAANRLSNRGFTEDANYRPTLVACPSQLVDVWYDDWNKFYNGLGRLVLKQFYGSETTITNPVRKATLLGTTLKHLTDFLDSLDPHDPATARVVIVTAYSTWHSRTLMAQESAPDDDVKGKGKARAVSVEEDEDFDDGYEPDDDDEAASANPRMVYTSNLRHRFGRVICDEAHSLKNRRTLTHLAVEHLKSPKLWFISATPMINHVKDLTGYLSLLWKDEWEMGENLEAEVFYSATGDLRSLLNSIDQEDEDRVALITAVNKGQNIFQLNPRNYAAIANTDNPDPVLIGLALRAILSQIQLRHTMATIIDMGNGKTLRIGENIPHYVISTVELRMSAMQSRQYAGIWEQHVGSLYTVGADEDRSAKTANAEPGKAELTGKLNMVTHRRLVHATLNSHLEVLVRRVGKKSLVKDINRWYETANDYGVTHFFLRTRANKFYRPYQDRLAMAEYIAGLSVKMQYLCDLLNDICIVDEKRVQIVVDMPMNQWVLEAFLVNLGLNVLSLRSAHSHSDRRETIRVFNDPSSPVDVLVTNFRTSSLGVNLQGCCHHTIIMDTAANINTVIQTIGRIHRLGQKEIQQITIITVDHTYDQVLQAKATKKMIAQLAGEARAVGETPEEMEENAEKLITKILGQRCSRKEWLDLDLRAKDKLKQAPFRLGKDLLLEREDRAKLQQRARLGDVSGRTRSTQVATSTADVAEGSVAASRRSSKEKSTDARPAVQDSRTGSLSEDVDDEALATQQLMSDIQTDDVSEETPEAATTSEGDDSTAPNGNGQPVRRSLFGKARPRKGAAPGATDGPLSSQINGTGAPEEDDQPEDRRPLGKTPPGKVGISGVADVDDLATKLSSKIVLNRKPLPDIATTKSPVADRRSESPLSDPPSSTEMPSRKPPNKVKEMPSSKKRAAEESEPADEAEPNGKRSRRNRPSVDYTEKRMDDI